MLLGYGFFDGPGLELLIRYGVMRKMIPQHREAHMRTLLNIRGIDSFLSQYIAETAADRLNDMSIDEALALAFFLDDVNTEIEL